MPKKAPFLIILITFILSSAHTRADDLTCPLTKIEVQRLPDLHIARGGHTIFATGDEVVVVGGHTTGFVPTATAEYLKDGQWHLLNTVYSHDEGFSVTLSSGKVLLGGGHLQPLGIGNQFVIEFYDPTRHSFRGYGCLDHKRCWAQALEMDSGKVIISGNWYEQDGIELYDGKVNNTPLKPVRQSRAMPYIFRTSKDDALVFGTYDMHAKRLDTIWIDHLKGEPTIEPFFEQWRPMSYGYEHHSDDSFIGDETKDDFTYLFSVTDSAGQVAIARCHNGHFSLLPTSCAVPTSCKGDSILWFTSLIADRQAERAYMVGRGKRNGRLFVLTILYKQNTAPLTLSYTEPMPETGMGITAVLTQEGHLLMAGGVDTTINNFEPLATAVLLYTGQQQTPTSATNTHWFWWLTAIANLLLIVLLLWIWKRRRIPIAPQQPEVTADEPLMQRLCLLMEEQRPYLNSDLKRQDVADLLQTNRTYITDCIKATRGQTFNQFINSYRVEHAKQLLSRHPDKKMSAVAIESGFNTESSFFRAFKAETGITPNEWRATLEK